MFECLLIFCKRDDPICKCPAVVSCFNPSPWGHLNFYPKTPWSVAGSASMKWWRWNPNTQMGRWNNKKTTDLFFFAPKEISSWFLIFFGCWCVLFLGVGCCVLENEKKSTEKTQRKLVNNTPFGVNKGLVTWSWILTRTSQESFDLKHAWNLTGNIWKNMCIMDYHSVSTMVKVSWPSFNLNYFANRSRLRNCDRLVEV